MDETIAQELPYPERFEPPALVFGDDPQRRDRIARILRDRGLRVVASDGIAGALERIEAQTRAGLIAIDVVRDGGAALDDMLTHVARRGIPLLVTATHGMIDVVTGAMPDGDAPPLIDPDDAEIASEVTAALTAPSPSLADSAGEARSRRLAELSEEVGRVARALASLSSGDRPAGAAPADRQDAVDALTMIRSLLRLRRLRDQFFAPALFADPAWDILLDLAAAAIERRKVAVSSLCIAAAVPATTALRWISTMSERGMLVRRPDPQDGRRVFMELSDEASAGVTGYLHAAQQVMVPTR